MYYETLTDLLNNDPAAYEYFYGLPPEMQTALQQQGGIVLRRQRHQLGVAEIGGEEQPPQLPDQRDDGAAIRQTQLISVHGDGCTLHSRGHGACDIGGIRHA